MLFYHAGHGVELSGANYLFPTDVPMLKVAEERLLRSEAIDLSDLLQGREEQRLHPRDLFIARFHNPR